MAKDDTSPMQSARAMQSAHAAPRCTARSKRTGLPCRAPAVRGWTVCRMHGARGGQPKGEAHPAWKHGLRGEDWTAQRRELAELMRSAREAMKDF